MPVKKDIRAEKKQLREHMRALRAGFSSAEKSDMDEKIASAVLSLKEYSENDTIFLYISKDIEVDTKKIVSAAISDGKHVAVPKCIPETRRMEFYLITSTDELKKGYYGIFEPDVSLCRKITDLSNGLCIVPGLAFDKNGYRLGFGMGYYDRFLDSFRGTAAGICYSKCLCEQLPRGYYDRNVEIIITERYIKKLKGGNEK